MRLSALFSIVSLIIFSLFSFEHAIAMTHATSTAFTLGGLGLLLIGNVNAPTFYVSQFANNVQLLLQQRGAKLKGACTMGSYVGKEASPVDQVGAVNMQPVIGRFAPIGRVDAALDRRWIYPSDYDLNQLLDKFDKLKMLLDPTSKFVENAGLAAERQIDDLIIAAFFNDAKTGEKGGTTTSFLAANVVAETFGATGAVGMTVSKLKEAKRLLKKYQVDKSDPLFYAGTSTQEDNMLAEAQIISLDYNNKPVLVEGEIERFLGINFIQSERMPLYDSDTREAAVWAKSGMHVGLWEDQIVDVSQRKDLQGHPWQAYLTLSAGATRLEEKKVIQILCHE